VAMNETAADNVRDKLIDRESVGVGCSVTERVRFADILFTSEAVNVSGADRVRENVAILDNRTVKVPDAAIVR